MLYIAASEAASEGINLSNNSAIIVKMFLFNFTNFRHVCNWKMRKSSRCLWRHQLIRVTCLATQATNDCHYCLFVTSKCCLLSFNVTCTFETLSLPFNYWSFYAHLSDLESIHSHSVPNYYHTFIPGKCTSLNAEIKCF